MHISTINPFIPKLTLSLSRVTDFKFLLQPHQKYYIRQYGGCGFILSKYYQILIASLIHFIYRRLRECTF